MPKMNNETSNQNPRRDQRNVAVVLIFISVFIVIIWLMTMSNYIKKPFSVSDSSVESSENSVSGSKDMMASLNEVALQTVDTDGDGLSDYQETNFYYTSPYLEDTDSDGLTDKEEVDAEEDPNCPLGTDCNTVVSTSSNEEYEFSLNSDDIDENEEEVYKKILSGQGNATGLRQLLLDSGMDKDALDQITDEQLMQSYQNALTVQDTQ